MVHVDAGQPIQTFLFADLAGFTALTEAHGDERAADIAADFYAEVREVLDRHDAEELKRIGDAVMIRAGDPHCAIAVARSLVCVVGARHGALGVRVGMHTGPAVERDGDWYGAVVNVAARVAEAAPAGEVLITSATREAAAAVGVEFGVRPRGRRQFKNVSDPVEVFALDLGPDHAADPLPVDPVCRMAVSPGDAELTLVHDGVEHHFCSQACGDRFRADPDRYVGGHAHRLDLRVSQDARERVAGRLGRAYRHGRLDDHELEERLERTFMALTRQDLEAVTHDLPPRRPPSRPVALLLRRWRARRDRAHRHRAR